MKRSLVLFVTLAAVVAACALWSGPVRAQYDGRCSTLDDVAALPEGHFCEVPDSAMVDAEKRPSEYSDFNGSSSAMYDSFQRVVGVRAITDAWGGGAWDSRRDRLILWGGGHNDYGGNEVYAFGLDALAWERLSDPTTFPNRSPSFQNDDGTPVSRHTYGGMCYSEDLDGLVGFSGAPDSGPGGCGVEGVWLFAFPANAWSLLSNVGSEPAKDCEDNLICDDAEDRVLFWSVASGAAAFDPVGGGWEDLDDEQFGWGKTFVLMGDTRQAIAFGDGGYYRVPNVRRFDIDSWDWEDILTTGANDIQTESNPGVAWDSSAGRVVAWSGGTDIYSLDPLGSEWLLHEAADTNAANPGPVEAQGGIYGRFQYSRTYNVFVMVDSAVENVFLYRFAPGTGEPRPPVDDDVPEGGGGDAGGADAIDDAGGGDDAGGAEEPEADAGGEGDPGDGPRDVGEGDGPRDVGEGDGVGSGGDIARSDGGDDETPCFCGFGRSPGDGRTLVLAGVAGALLWLRTRRLAVRTRS